MDYQISSLKPLRNSWQRDLNIQFNDQQWETICKHVFLGMSCNKIIEQNYKFIYRVYLTPLRLSRIYPNLSPKCNRCKTYTGSLLHMFWECKHLTQFWSSVNKFVEKKFNLTPNGSSLRCLFGTIPTVKNNAILKKQLVVISYISKKCILLCWNHEKPPTFEMFQQILQDTMNLEYQTYALKNRLDLFDELWGNLTTL